MTSTTTGALVPYASSFKEAGDALIEWGLEHRLQDLILFPALSCYRHAVEHGLKDIIYLWARHETGHDPPEVIISHDLRLVWARARRVLEAAWPNGETAELDAMAVVIGELASVDPDGYRLRYDRDRKGFAHELPETLRNVDLRHMKTVMGELMALLSGSADGIAAMLSAEP